MRWNVWLQLPNVTASGYWTEGREIDEKELLLITEKLDGLALLITDPPPSSFTTL